MTETVRKGQVLRVTRWVGGEGSDRVVDFNPPAWAVAIETAKVTKGVYVRWLANISNDELEDEYSFGNVLDDVDEFEVVPTEQWPDEICVAMATHVLSN